MTNTNIVATALAGCEQRADQIEKVTTTVLVRIAGAPDIERLPLIAALDAILMDVKALRAQLAMLRTELPIH